MDRSDFIEALVADLQPVRPPMRWLGAVGIWSAVSWLFVTTEIFAKGALREGVGLEILASPRFAFELAIGLATGFAAIAVGLEMGTPGAPWSLRRPHLPVALMIAWILVAGSDAFSSLVVTSAPMRTACFAETLLVSLPPWAFALHLLRRRALLQAGRAGFLTGAAAAAIPAFWMQLACVTQSHHNLTAHLSPILIVGLLGAFVASRVVPRG